MYKPNKKHLQPLLISQMNDLPEKHRQRLEESWTGTFYREFFCRLKEDPFAVLYAEVASRPNTAVNVLVGLEVLKAGFGWSDEELYDHFIFDVQVRYALGQRDLKEGNFELQTLYNFRRRLSRYNQEHGTNLLAQAFSGITDQQITAFKVQTNTQRMDSTQIASNILDASRLHLAVEAVQRLVRLMNEAEALAGKKISCEGPIYTRFLTLPLSTTYTTSPSTSAGRIKVTSVTPFFLCAFFFNTSHLF